MSCNATKSHLKEGDKQKSFARILWLIPTTFLGLGSHQIIFLSASFANSSCEWKPSWVSSASYSPSSPVIKGLRICQSHSDSKIFIPGDVGHKRTTAWASGPRSTMESWCLERKKSCAKHIWSLREDKYESQQGQFCSHGTNLNCGSMLIKRWRRLMSGLTSQIERNGGKIEN